VSYDKGNRARTFFADTTHIESWSTPMFQELLSENEAGAIWRAVFFSTDDVWFYYESIIWKEGPVARKAWSVGTRIFPTSRPRAATLSASGSVLIPFPKEKTHLKFVRGSHLGPLHIDSQPDADERLA